MNGCEKWLLSFLAQNGQISYSDVQRAAKAEGFKKSELKAARKRLGVCVYHQFADGGEREDWFWSLNSKELER